MKNKDGDRFFDRELSWLAFNARVLQEAADPTVPVGERLDFLAIYSSNLDEFFRVRVASLRSLLRLKKKRVEQLSFDPVQLLREIHDVVDEQQTRFGEIFRHEIVPELGRAGISLINETKVTPQQVAFLRADFVERIAPLIQPILLSAQEEAPFLKNRGTYLLVELWPPGGRVLGAHCEHALIEVPSPPLPRFVALPARDGHHEVLFIDDVIRLNLNTLFPEREAGNAWAIKLSRDAELYLEDEFSGSLVESIRKSVKKRETSLPCRFLYDLHAPYPLVRDVRERFALAEQDLVPGGRYHNLHDLADFPRFGHEARLSEPPLPPLPHPELEHAPSILAAIAERDRMLHYPYQSFDPVVRMLEEAGKDPAVESIAITLYRVANESSVVQALIDAAENGKQVTAFVEVKARFDEELNLLWAERMEAAGVRTLYSIPGLKVHAKLALIVRREDGKRRRYAYLGTGNFNEKTARLYTDHALLTADRDLTVEVQRVFRFLAGELEEPRFEHLMVAPFDLRKRFYRLIEREILAAVKGKPAGMILKMNSLEDDRIIARLYRASRAGVPIDMIVRGICCLVPGVPGMSETIRVRSIVDRFLEHGRIYLFENGAKPLYWLASADWMNRNLSRRVEVAFPVRDPALQQELRTILDLQLADNQKARIIDELQSNRYARTGGPPVRAQVDTYRFFETRSRPEPALSGTHPDELHAARASGMS
jgi:polyphosphate kinase